MTDDNSGGLCCICLRECLSHSCTVCNKPCHPFPLYGRPVVEGYGGGVLCANCDPDKKGNIEGDAVMGKSAEKRKGNFIANKFNFLWFWFSSMRTVFCYMEKEPRTWITVELNIHSWFVIRVRGDKIWGGCQIDNIKFTIILPDSSTNFCPIITAVLQIFQCCGAVVP